MDFNFPRKQEKLLNPKTQFSVSISSPINSLLLSIGFTYALFIEYANRQNLILKIYSKPQR